MTTTELVAFIREICAREFKKPQDLDFFRLDYSPGESPDDALVRLFNDEKAAQQENDTYESDEGVVLTLCHG